MSVSFQFIPNPASIQAYLRGPTGPVAREMLRRGEVIRARAYQLLSGQMVEVHTGRLRDSLEVRQWFGVGEAGVEVSANAPYSEAVHEGTRPRVIVPRNARVLRFPKAGGFIYTRRVDHPGSRGRPFLRRALIESF